VSDGDKPYILQQTTFPLSLFQVEFDVRDYRPEELSIKTEGDVLIVLARRETKTEDGGSFVSKQFEQRFTLPQGVRPEAITSSLGRDGTLTVSAPREAPALTLHSTSGSKQNEALNVYGHEDKEGLPHPKVKYDDDKFQISLDCHRYRPEELDVKVEGSSIIITAKQVRKKDTFPHKAAMHGWLEDIACLASLMAAQIFEGGRRRRRKNQGRLRFAPERIRMKT